MTLDKQAIRNRANEQHRYGTYATPQHRQDVFDLVDAVGRLEASVKQLAETLEAIANFKLHASDTPQLGLRAVQDLARQALAAHEATQKVVANA